MNKRYKYYESGKIHKIYCLNSSSKIHNECGPAIQIFTEDGKIILESFFKNGEYHNLNGPSIIRYSNETIIEKTYCIENRSYSYNDYKKQIAKLLLK